MKAMKWKYTKKYVNLEGRLISVLDNNKETHEGRCFTCRRGLHGDSNTPLLVVEHGGGKNKRGWTCMLYVAL
jgi:hypothetical protein